MVKIGKADAFGIVVAVVMVGVVAWWGVEHYLWAALHFEQGDAAVSPDRAYVAQPLTQDEGDLRPYGSGVYVRRRLMPWPMSTLVFAAYCRHPDPRVEWRSARELVVHCEVAEETPVVLQAPGGIEVIHADGRDRRGVAAR